MTNEELNKFDEFAHKYAYRFVDCFCATTGDKWPKIFAKNHYGRFLDYFDEKYQIEIKPNNMEMYLRYENIMVDEINKIIEQHKIKAREKAKKEKEAQREKNIKRKKKG